MDVSISHPTDRPNFASVRVGKITIYFSYETPIAFHHPATGEVVRENDWGPTTGKHLNWVDGNASKRVTGREFERRLRTVLEAGEHVIEAEELFV